MSDSSQHQEADAGARVNWHQLHQLLEFVPAGAYTCDRDGLITFFNKRAVELWGREPRLNDPVDRFCGSYKLFDKDQSPIDHDQCWMALALRQSREYNGCEIVIERPDGSRVTTLAHANPMRDASGNITGAVNLLVDITERKLHAEALRESEERFRTLADNISPLVWMADETGSIFWYNSRWFDYTGTTLDEVRGWGWRKVHHPDHVDRVVERIRRSFDSGSVWEDTFPLRGKDGGYRWFLSRAVPIRDEAGRVLRWLGTNTDITEQRETEEALRQADRRKDEFLAMLAHELRNPLAPISNSLQILRMAEDLDPAVDKLREIMERQTNLLVRLVDDLLEVSGIAQGKIELRREVIDLASVIRNAVEISRPLIDEAGHQLAVTVAPNPLMVEVDAARIAQVVANLLNNAAKYTPKGGQIWLSVRPQGTSAVISVRDDGVGISSEMLPRVFDMFEQAHNLYARPQGGLGIGLTLAKKLVQLHGGHIEAKSDGPGKGSQFTIYLPLAAAREEPLVRSIGPRGSAPKEMARRILIVDDRRDTAVILGKLLETLGHQVLTTDSGQTALELARAEHPEVVISDIAMEDMDGYELARRLRRERGLEGVVLVALTGYGQDADRRRASEAGFDHYLVKPVGLDVLKRLLSDLPAARTELSA